MAFAFQAGKFRREIVDFLNEIVAAKFCEKQMGVQPLRAQRPQETTVKIESVDVDIGTEVFGRHGRKKEAGHMDRL
jgi:hypothetical protein